MNEFIVFLTAGWYLLILGIIGLIFGILFYFADGINLHTFQLLVYSSIIIIAAIVMLVVVIW